MTDTPLIPRTLLFGNPQKSGLSISPSGEWLAWIAPYEGVRNIWIAPREALDEARAITHDGHRGLNGFTWCHDDRHMLFLQDRDGDEAFHVHALDIVTGTAHDLTPIEGARAGIAGLSREHPDEVVLSIHEPGQPWGDLWRVSLTTGDRRLIRKNEGMAWFLLDLDLQVRFAVRMTSAGGMDLCDPQGQVIVAFDAEDAGVSGVLGLDAAAKTIYLLDSRGRDTAALVAHDIASGTQTVLAHDPRADIGGTISDRDSFRPLAAFATVARRETIVLDEAIAPDLDFLDASGVGDWWITARSRDGRFWTLGSASDLRPGASWLYDREESSVRLVFEGRPELTRAPLARMHPMTFTARDGLALVGYLSLPPEHEGALETRPETPIPLVLMVHGGPWSRDHFCFDSEHHWLANRGYAVLAVNFRGSTGFGKSFVSAADHQWGAAMDDDLEDAVDELVRRGIVDPARVAIMGASYGGYAVLSGLTRSPERYVCGIDIVGPANLETLLASTPPHWEVFRARLHRALGDPATPDGLALLRDRSPLHKAGKICRPLLIAQGGNDPRVPQAEADAMAEAMASNRIPVTYLLYPDEGHGFHRPANQIAFRIAAEAFLQRYLGGRFQGPEPGECLDARQEVIRDDNGLLAALADPRTEGT